MTDPVVPKGWSFDPDYGFDGSPAWWHDDCPSPTVIDEGELGGIAHEERSPSGHLVAVVCGDCDACFSINRRPKQEVQSV